MLQVVGEVAARQLDRAAVGAGDHVEGAGGEVALWGGGVTAGQYVTRSPLRRDDEGARRE